MHPSKTEPSVCAVMLTANRPEMAKQAVECFRAQTYGNKILVVYDSGRRWGFSERTNEDHIYAMDATKKSGLTIGALRNAAIDAMSIGDTADILIHWDDDDYSHTNRIAEQVRLLQSSGADCVGYNECLFWREPQHSVEFPARNPGGCDLGVRNVLGGAWLYRNPNPSYALGTSLCYWRRTWENKPFEATSVGEDLRFIAGLKVAAVSSLHTPDGPWWKVLSDMDKGQPRMIARIHAGNTSCAYRADAMQRESERSSPAWKRVPAWDKFCQEQFAK